MLKQSIPPPAVDSCAGPLLPPLSTLPQWTRINTLSRLCPPRPLMKDRLQRLPETIVSQKMSEKSTAWDDGSSDYDDSVSVESSSTCIRRIHQLEHAIVFLQQQHDETLTALHEEVDRLKRDNRGAYIICMVPVYPFVQLFFILFYWHLAACFCLDMMLRTSHFSHWLITGNHGILFSYSISCLFAFDFLFIELFCHRICVC